MDLSKFKFLIVDDQDSVIEFLESILIKKNVKRVVPAYDGEKAWNYLETNTQDPVDFIICDYHMPNMNGLDLLRKVRAEEAYKETPFLLLTSHCNAKMITEVVTLGADNYVIKPSHEAEILERIKSTLDRRGL